MFRSMRALVAGLLVAALLSVGVLSTTARPASAAFSDVTAGTMHHVEILWVQEVGIATGYGDSTYRPLNVVNRDAMAAFLYRLAGSPNFTAPAQSPFADITPATQFYKEMTWLAARGISTGWEEADGTRTYRPLQPIARDAMAAFLYRLAGSPAHTPPATPRFSDVAVDNQFVTEISWLASSGVTTGWPDGTYRPLDSVARDAMAAFIYRMAAFAPVREYTGSGNVIVMIPRLGTRYWVATLEHDGQVGPPFEVWTVDANRARIGPIVEVPHEYSGTVGLTTSGPGGADVRGVQVFGPGNWRLVVRGVEVMPQFTGGTYQGSGDQVVRVDRVAGQTVRFDYTGGGLFRVMGMDSRGRWHAIPRDNRGNWSGTWAIPSNIYALEIMADGPWTLSR